MISKLLGGDLVKSVGGIIDSLHTSDDEKAQAKIKLKEIEAQLNKAQTDINLVAKIVETTYRNELCYCYFMGICN